VSSFHPNGYVTTPEAILEAAVHWYAERLAALEASAAAGLSTELRGVEALSRAISRHDRISQEIQQVYSEIVPQIVNRLRNILHTDKLLKVYYFGGLFSNGRHAIDSDFWATAAADGVLESGKFFPFGMPTHLFESRLSYQLFLLRAELVALFAEQPVAKKSFPKAKMPEIVAALREFDDLPNRAAQHAAIRGLPQFRSFRITDEVLRDAARQAPRPRGRRRNQPSD
jgi:hypothetical protein